MSAYYTKKNNSTGYYNRTNTKIANNGGFNTNSTYNNNNKVGKVDKDYKFNTHDNYHQNKKMIGEEIKKWIKTVRDDNYDEMIHIFNANKNSWKEQFDMLAKKLTKAHKEKVLDYVLKSNDFIASNKKKHRSYTLLNENIWFVNGSEIKDEEEEFQKIIKTFDILISNGFNFIDFSVLSNEIVNKSEIMKILSEPKYFYQVLTGKNKIIPSELAKQLENYVIRKMKIRTPEAFEKTIKTNSAFNTGIIEQIDNFFTRENLISTRLKNTESFLGAIINPDNKITSSLRNRLYTYFTQIYWNDKHFVSCLKLMFNKITDTNSILFIDNMQFILSRDVNTMSKEIFKLVVLRESTNVTEKNIIQGLLSELAGRDDLVMYFNSINIQNIRETFVSNIIEKFDVLIEEIIKSQQLSNPDVPLDEFRTNNYGALMMILGIAYSKNFSKERILNVVSSIIADSDHVNMIKPFGIFIENSQITCNNLTNQEHELLVGFITKYYLNTSLGMREKYVIENILSDFVSKCLKSTVNIRKEHIDAFLTTGSFIIEKVQKVQKVQTKIKSETFVKDVSNKFYNLMLDDEESDEETDEEFDDYPEPDEKIFSNISQYFKTKDEETSYDDLEYFITKTKVPLDDFLYGLLYSFADRRPNDISRINILIQKLSLIPGFEKISSELKILIEENSSLIQTLGCDNPKLDDIIINFK